MDMGINRVTKLAFLSIVLLLLPGGAAVANADSARARDLATYEWAEGDYLGRATVQEYPDGNYGVRLSTGMRKSEDGSLYVAAEDGGIYRFLVRDGVPIVRSALIVQPELALDPHPWEAARTVIARRERLREIAREWSLGDEDARAAAEALEQIAGYDWEHRMIRVEVLTKLPPEGR